MARKSSTHGKTAKPKGIVPSAARGHAPRPLAHMVERLTKGLLGRHGFAHGAIVTKWPDIVGPDMARQTQPERIVFSRDGVSGGTLHLRCQTGAVATELQHLEPEIIDRINMFFGYQAVVRIKLVQGPLPKKPEPPARPAPAPLSPSEIRELSGTVANVDDPELRAALERLGHSIMGRKHKPKAT